jgi:hypoxia up-regulated 1
LYDQQLISCRLAAFDHSDKSRRVREEVLNSLEAFTYRARDYLEDESFIGASVPAVRTTLEEKLSAASDWLYSEGTEAGEKELKAKLKELEDIVNPVLKRKIEATKRPDAIKELKDTIAHIQEVSQLVDGQIKTQIQESSKSSEAVAAASKSSATPSPSTKDELDELEEGDVSSSAEPAEPEITEVPTIYTEDDLKKVQDTIASSQKWLEENEAKQAKLGPTDDPAFTVKDLQAEKKRIDDVVMDMMMKKMRHFKPPGQQKPKASSKPKPKKAKKPAAPKKDAGEAPTDEELQEALKKAGVDSDKIKLKNFGHKDSMTDEMGRKLKKLNIDEDSSEEDILRAIDDLTKEQGEKEKEGEKHDEL